MRVMFIKYLSLSLNTCLQTKNMKLVSQVNLTPSMLDIDFSEAEKRISRFIKEYVENAGAKGIVLGLSGCIDSGTTAALSSLAIGGDNVIGLMLPEEENFSQKDIDDAKLVADKFKLKTQICDMS